MEKVYLKLCNLISTKKTVVENICKVVLKIFIEFKNDSNTDSRVIRLENEKLNNFKMVLFEHNFQGEFISEKVYLKICT